MHDDRRLAPALREQRARLGDLVLGHLERLPLHFVRGRVFLEGLHPARDDSGRWGRRRLRQDERNGVRILVADEPAREQQIDEVGRLCRAADLPLRPAAPARAKQRAHLLEDVKAMEDLERVRLLFEDLDTKTDLIQLLGLAERAEGVRIFIGSENKLFSLSGSALIVSPFEDTEQKIVGVLGVIGPTRLNYARIIPMVDYTARLLGRLVP